MHPQLASDKKIHCGEFIKALQDCHAQGYFNRLLGNCNGAKHELNMCLREERLLRTARNREESIKREEKKQSVWKAIDEES